MRLAIPVKKSARMRSWKSPQSRLDGWHLPKCQKCQVRIENRGISRKLPSMARLIRYKGGCIDYLGAIRQTRCICALFASVSVTINIGVPILLLIVIFTIIVGTRRPPLTTLNTSQRHVRRATSSHSALLLSDHGATESSSKQSKINQLILTKFPTARCLADPSRRFTSARWPRLQIPTVTEVLS